MLLSMLLITILVARASSETVIQSCECSLCTCTAYPAEPPAATTSVPTAASTAAPTVAPTAALTTPFDCGDWEEFEGNCYKLISEKKIFSAASENCRQLGGQLASVHSERENSFLYSLSSGYNVSSNKINIKGSKLSAFCP